MEYLNFELRIGIRNGEEYPVSVIRSPAGETSAMVSFPVNDPQFKSRLEGIEKSRYGKTRKTNRAPDLSDPEMDASRDVVFSSSEIPSDAAKVIGSDLFNKFFSAEIRSCFRSSLQKAREEKKGLRIRLRIEAPDLAAIPWEYLYDDVEGDYFCLSTETPIIRFLELARPPQPLTTEPPLSILGVIAGPKDLPALDIEREKAQMQAAVEHLIDKGIIKLTWLEGQSWRELQASMRNGPWHVLHFIGHGSFNTDIGEGAIALVNDDGNTYQLDATNLGRLLAGHPSLRLVVLNSCEGARTSATNLFSSIGASLIRKGIPAVVSMQYEISDRGALEFSRTFYETIAEGMAVDAALQEARKAINFAMDGSLEWGTPVLHMRAPNGLLFDIDVNQAIFSGILPAKQFRPVASTAKSDDRIAPAPLQADDDRGLTILMKKVRQFWVEGVLDQSLQHSELIQLGLDNMPHLVNSPWGSMPLSDEHSIETVFNEVGRSLLILGEPGAGKTIMLLSLAKELLYPDKLQNGLPLPVVFNLSSWTNSRKTFPQWLAEELSTKYMIPVKIGESWIRDCRLILLLDGLDEVGADKRNACITEINRFLEESTVMGIATCCRFKEYIELDTKLTLNGAIRLKLLSKEKIMNYLHGAGASYLGLIQLLKKDPSLLQLAETPFMLSLMMKIYQHFPEDQRLETTARTINDRKRQLLDAYVKRQFRLVKEGSIV